MVGRHIRTKRFVPADIIAKTSIYILLVFLVAVITIPLLSMIFASFKTMAQLGNEFGLKPPKSLYLKNYIEVIKTGLLGIGLKNSIILSLSAIFIQILTSSTAAYIFSRFKFKYKKIVMGLYLISWIMPQTITEVARFKVIFKMGIYNTLFAPIAIYSIGSLVNLFVYMQFLEKIPVAIDESASIDGASYIRIFRSILFPLLIPASATVAILTANGVLNDFFTPYLYIPSTSYLTLTTMLMYFMGQQTGTWSNLSAAISIVLVVTMTFYLVFQKYIFSGLVAGAVKE